MNYFFYILILFFFFEKNLFAQDTILITPKIYFSSLDDDKYFGKGYHGEYGCEEVIYSNVHRRIDYCYYRDSIRTCFGKEYLILNDSILKISNSDSWKTYQGNEFWNYKKPKSGNYFISRKDTNFYEFGEASSLIPLRILGDLITTTKSKKDTLWYISFLTEEPRNHRYKVEFHKSKILGEIFEYNQVDEPPKQLSGLPLEEVKLQNINYCFSEPYYDITTMACIITKDGKVKNIEQAIGGASPDYCPQSIMNIVLDISNWGILKPALKKNNEVNVRWFVAVNVKEMASQKHPAYLDNERNRKKYIRSKR